jgi:hypothetical protein
MTAGLSSPPFAWPDGELARKRVVQCALSRVCGGCGRSLGRPIAFVGSQTEVDRNAFHAPPMHTSCAQELVTTGAAGTRVVLTSGYEFVRPGAEDLDRSPTFRPNSVLP